MEDVVHRQQPHPVAVGQPVFVEQKALHGHGPCGEGGYVAEYPQEGDLHRLPEGEARQARPHQGGADAGFQHLIPRRQGEHRQRSPQRDAAQALPDLLPVSPKHQERRR